MIRTFIFSILFISAQLSSAAVVYVNGSVSTSGDGSTWNTAFKSIEEAVAREVKEETGWKIDNLIPF